MSHETKGSCCLEVFLVKKGLLKVVAKHLLKTPVLESLFHKVAAGFKSAVFLKRDSSKGIFQ